MSEEQRKRIQDGPVEPEKIFDDVYYIGRKAVGIFAVRTSEGIVLIDSMDPVDADDLHIIPGMKKLGLNPEDISTIIITHGHFDHFAGAKHLQERFHCKVGIGRIDAGFMVYSEYRGTQIEYPHIDFILEDRQEIKIGDHSFIPVLTPGHTPGGMSLIFNCHDYGVEHWVSLWVGAGLPRPSEPESERMTKACQFANSVHLFKKVCDEYNCDVVLGVHPHRCNLFEKLEKLKQRKQGEENAFVVGPEGVKANLSQRGTEALTVAQEIIDMM